MVVDYMICGRHKNGYKFIAPVRIWGQRNTDFDQRLKQIVELSGEIEEWNLEERIVRRLLSLLYAGEGHTDLQFVFYGDGTSNGEDGDVEDDIDNPSDGR